MRARRSLVFCLVVALAAFLSSPLVTRAEEMSFHAIRLSNAAVCGDVCPAAIEAVGQITPNTPARFLAFLQSQGRSARRTVFLESPGGNVLASMELGMLLRQAGATAVIARIYGDGEGGATLTSGQCFSACVYAFLGARKRVVPDRSQVGIHRMFEVEEGVDASGTMLVRRRRFDDGEMRGILMRYTGRMGVSPGLIEAAERIPSDDLKILSRSQLRRWHLASSSF